MTTGIGAAGDDFSVAVFLNELTVADIIFVIAFEAKTLFVFLDGSTIALTVFEGAFELRTIGIACNALTVDHAILELALEHIARLCGEFSLAVRLIRLPQTHVLIAVLPDHRTLSLFVAFIELTCVFIAIGILRDACARALAVDIVTFVNIAVLELIYAATILYVVLPLTDIHVARSIFEGALALTDVVHPLTIVRRTITPVEVSLTVLLVVFPVAFVISAVGKGIHALA